MEVIQAKVVTPQQNVNVDPCVCNAQPTNSTPTWSNDTHTVDDETVNFTEQFKGLFDAFAESIPEGSHQEKSSKGFFKKFSEYIGSKEFEDSLAEKSEKYKVPPKQIAKNFFLKVLGIIGDILGIVVNTACSILDTAVSLLATLLHGPIEVVGKAGNAIVRVISCNQTNKAVA